MNSDSYKQKSGIKFQISEAMSSIPTPDELAVRNSAGGSAIQNSAGEAITFPASTGNETFEFEGRQYVNPDISRDEQTAFVDTLRSIMNQYGDQIKAETHNLGTDVDFIRGGLNGSEGYWRGLYQAPQTNAVVANMRAVAQQTALNTALSNYQNMLQERYNQAYRNYQKRAYNSNRTNTGGTTTNVTGAVKNAGKVVKKIIGSIDVGNGNLSGVDPEQEAMVKKETERIMREEGFDEARARAKALVNLNLNSSTDGKTRAIMVGPELLMVNK